MSKNMTVYVDASHFEAVVLASGLPVVRQKGWVKVDAPGGRVYVAATKKVGRVDLSGFRVDLPLVRAYHEDEQPTLQVQQGLNHHMPEEATDAQVEERRTQLVETLRAVLDHLKTLPAPEKPSAKVRAAKGPQPKGWTPGAIPAAPKKEKGTGGEARKEAIAQAAKKEQGKVEQKRA